MEENSSENIEIKVEKRKKERISWMKEYSFNDNVSLLNAIKQENTWSYMTKFTESDGSVVVRYRCNKVKFRGPQCNATIRVVYKSSSDQIDFYRATSLHNHEEINSKSSSTRFSLTPLVKEEIKSILATDYEIKPKQMLEILMKNNKSDRMPSLRQVNNYLIAVRSKSNTVNVSLSEIEHVLSEKSAIPDDDDETYVVDYDLNFEDPNYFRFFVSTKTLLKNACKTEHVHVDTNFKLMWRGFPIFLIGTTDFHNVFHCCGISVCTNETAADFSFTFEALKKGVEHCSSNYKPKILVGDVSESLQSGFLEAFGQDSLFVTCYNYMIRDITKKLHEQISDKQTREKILSDIDTLQMSKNAYIFLEALNFFIAKWEGELPSFIDYFRENWVLQNSNWYQAVCSFIPNNNGPLEDFVKTIKEEHTLRERLPLTSFVSKTFNFLSSYSKNYVDNPFHEVPNVSLETWTEGNTWAKSSKNIATTNLDSTEYQTFKIPGRNMTDVELCRESFSTFDEFREVNFETYNVLLPLDNNYLKGECDCPYFFKHYTCKHIIGLCIRLKIIDPPLQAKTIVPKSSFGERRKSTSYNKLKTKKCKVDEVALNSNILTNDFNVTFDFRGLIVPVFTPICKERNDVLNVEVIPQYANYLQKNGIQGILVNGTTGEGSSLTISERLLLTERWVTACKQTKQILMVQVGGAPMPQVLHMAKRAEETGVNALLCLPDVYNKPTTIDDLIKYLVPVSKAAPKTPLLYYHIPSYTNVNLNMVEFLTKVNETNAIPTFIGIKFTSVDLNEGSACLRVGNGKFVVFLGADEILAGAAMLGFDSAIVATLNVLPQNCIEVFDSFKNAETVNVKEVRKNQEVITKFLECVDKYGNRVSALKAAMNVLSSIDVGPPRGPSVSLTQEKSKRLKSDLSRLFNN